MSITQNISEITPLSAFTSPNRPAEVDNLVENELPNLTQELGLLIPQINETTYQASLVAQNTEASKNIATTQAGIATTKASEANTSANQALTYKNQVMGYVVPAGASYSVDQLNTKYSAMTKAQFNALAEERKANRAGSGFDNFGKHNITIATNTPVNEGMWTVPTLANQFILGSESSNVGVSVTQVPNICINGIKHTINKVNSNAPFSPNVLQLPTAPNIYPHDTVLTAEQIASGVIKHADSSNSGLIVNGKFDTDTSGWTNRSTGSGSMSYSAGRVLLSGTDGLNRGAMSQTISTVIGKKYIAELNIEIVSGSLLLFGTSVGSGGVSASNGRNTYEFTASTTSTTIIFYTTSSSGIAYLDNIAVYPADAISRSDLSMAESWHEDISEKNFVYDNGNTQSLSTANIIGVTPTNGNFTGFETFSLFGNWQTPSGLIGKGYVWSNLTEAQKRAFISNPENNCYLDGDKTIQVRYRVRVVQGCGDSWNSPLNLQFWVGYSNVVNTWIKAKGKQVNISDYLSSATSEGGYVGGVTTAKDVLSLSGDYGVYGASNNGSLSTQCGYEGKCFALPIALVHRRNQGMYHPVYNPNGSKKASDDNFWYNTAVSFTSISDCFDPAKLLTASGYIGSVSGRPDGLFYDQVHESDILDLRNSSKKVEDYNRLIGREFNKLVAGTTRGKEGEYHIIKERAQPATATHPYIYIPHLDYESGERISWFDSLGNSGATVLKAKLTDGYGQYWSTTDSVIKTINEPLYVSKKSTRIKSNTLLHCDIIGNPTNYPTAWKQSGVFGTPLVATEDGTSLLPDGARDVFKLSRPLKTGTSILLALRSTDNGATWASFTPTFTTLTNEITLTNEPANNLVMIYYQTKTSMADIVANSEVLEIGEVFSANHGESQHGQYLCSTLLRKVPVFYGKSQGYPLENYELFGKAFWDNSARAPIHKALTYNQFGTSNPAVKVFPYLTRLNGKAYLNLVFKEMKYNGTSWGDDNKFNIVNNVSTTTDNNAQTVLIGQKTVELPYFIGADE